VTAVADLCGAGTGLVATCSRGLEEVLAREVSALGGREATAVRGAVSFVGGLELLYLANVHLRTAMRVLVPLARGRVSGRSGLYDLAASPAWEHLLPTGQTFAVDAVGRCPGLDNSAFAARVVKDAVVDRLRRLRGRRPDVDLRSPDLRIHLHLTREESAVSLDSSGPPLSRRGYRARGGPAPLNEALAAGILALAGYDGSQPLVDPMCGTGTIAVEAALAATRTAPGLERGFACERWPVHDPQLLAGVRREAASARRRAPVPIVASDSDGRAVAATRRNARAAGIEGVLRLARADVRRLDLPEVGGLVVTNPPYGQRLGDVEDLCGLYRSLGDALKRGATGWTAWLLVGDRTLAAAVGLRAQRRVVLYNGPIECRLLRYDLVAGSWHPDSDDRREAPPDGGGG
jgi:putative N6-adenine-specific DNA methylase